MANAGPNEVVSADAAADFLARRGLDVPARFGRLECGQKLWRKSCVGIFGALSSQWTQRSCLSGHRQCAGMGPGPRSSHRELVAAVVRAAHASAEPANSVDGIFGCSDEFDFGTLRPALRSFRRVVPGPRFLREFLLAQAVRGQPVRAPKKRKMVSPTTPHKAEQANVAARLVDPPPPPPARPKLLA